MKLRAPFCLSRFFAGGLFFAVVSSGTIGNAATNAPTAQTNAPAPSAKPGTPTAPLPPAVPAPNVDLDKETGKPVITTPSKLKYVDIVLGPGAAVKTGDHVTVNYIGKLADGTKFDSSYDRGQPMDFIVGARQVIPGWDEGVVGLKVGGKRKLIIPPELGYGLAGVPNVIPPNATLTFEVELLSINPN
jgi:peptidylprolyl isomerase